MAKPKAQRPFLMIAITACVVGATIAARELLSTAGIQNASFFVAILVLLNVLVFVERQSLFGRFNAKSAAIFLAANVAAAVLGYAYFIH